MYGTLFALLATVAADPTAATTTVQQQPVRVWLSERGPLDKGDRVRVRVRTELDGYLLVLHAEPDGRVRVLFPLDPFQDNFIRGNEEYELPGRGDRETFSVFVPEGEGTVYAAHSRDPFRVQDYSRGDHWDYLLEAFQVQEDAEAELTALVERMATSRFDYDLVRYAVGRTAVARGYYGYGGSRFNVSLRFGRPYYPFYGHRHAFYYSSCYDWYWYDPFYYDSWYCSPYWSAYYDPFFRSRRYYYGYYRYPRTVIVYAPASTRFIDRRFTFKNDHNVADGSDLLGMRRRIPSSGATVRRTVETVDVASRRRAVTDTRRIGTTARQPDAARRPDAVRRPDVGAPTVTTRRPDEARPVTPRRPADVQVREREGRQVKPAGWGITDGTRTIPARRPAVEPRDATQRPEARRPDAPADVRRPQPVTPDRKSVV